MVSDKLKQQLEDVREDAQESSRMLERSSAETNVLDVVVAIELLEDDVVVEYYDDSKATVIVDAEALSEAKEHALRSYMGAVPNWHLDDRPRNDGTWRARRD